MSKGQVDKVSQASPANRPGAMQVPLLSQGRSIDSMAGRRAGVMRERLRSISLSAAERSVLAIERVVVRVLRSLHLSIGAARLRHDPELAEWAEKARAKPPPTGDSRLLLLEKRQQILDKMRDEIMADKESSP